MYWIELICLEFISPKTNNKREENKHHQQI